VAILVALNCVWLCNLPAIDQVETVAQVARRIDETLHDMEKVPSNDTATTLAQSLAGDLELLKRQSIMVFGEREKRLQDESDNLRRGIASWSTDAVGNSARRRIVLADMRRAWAEMKSQWPTEALEILPPLWSCPMHSELIESVAGTCPVCGMPLEPIYVTQPRLSPDPIIRAAIFPKTPLQVGRKADL